MSVILPHWSRHLLVVLSSFVRQSASHSCINFASFSFICLANFELCLCQKHHLHPIPISTCSQSRSQSPSPSPSIFVARALWTYFLSLSSRWLCLWGHLSLGRWSFLWFQLLCQSRWKLIRCLRYVPLSYRPYFWHRTYGTSRSLLPLIRFSYFSH